MRTTAALVALSALTFVSAQNSTEFTIDPTSVPLSQRNTWCIAQENTCGLLCSGTEETNSCDLDTLDYSCTCSNGSAPGLQYYSQTIDSFVCQQNFTDCNANNVGNANGQAACITDVRDKCGTLDPSNVTSSSASTASASSGTASATASSATASGTAAASSTQSAAAAPTDIQRIGTGVVAAGIGLFAYLL